MEGGVILQVPLVTQWPVSLATVDGSMCSMQLS